MKIRKGREKIGTFKGSSLIVDWSYLLEEHGLRKELEDFERTVGRFLFLLAVFIMAGCFISDFVQGRFLITEMLVADRLIELIFALGFALMLYAFYLGRNRENYIDRIQIASLYDLNNRIKMGNPPQEIDIEHYFDHDMLNLIDDLLNRDEQRFMSALIAEVGFYPKSALAITRLGITPDQLKEAAHKFELEQATHVDEWIVKLLAGSFGAAMDTGLESVDEQALLLYVCTAALPEQLLELNVSDKEIKSLRLWLKNRADTERYFKLFKTKSALKPTSTVNRAFTSRYSPTLVEFSRDFTVEVARGDFTYSLAREEEIEQLISYVQEGDRSATLLIGPTGIGKTTMLKSLAVRMVVEDVPQVLQDRRLVGFDFARAYALSPNIDTFKSRVEKILEETASAGNIVLVVDDFEQVVQVREELLGELVSLFVNAFDKYKLRVIATSTPDGYSRHIKPQSALAAIFKTMEVKEPADEVVVQILMDLVPAMEKKYKIRISFDAIVRLVNLSHKVAFEKVLPDKAIDLLEETIVEAGNQKLEFVNEQLVEQVVSRKVGVKVGAIDSSESKVLINMEAELHKSLIGQTDAVNAVAAALRRSRAGLSGEKRPIAAFLFYGPTGVGKTELAKALTAVYYGDEKLMIRLDMSEYQEQENLQRLIGEETDKGFQGGFLTEAVRSRPFALILLDEIEKANPKVLDLFLQVLDEGNITDGLGRKIDFTNTIIIATSNAGSKEIAELTEKGTDYAIVAKTLEPRLRESLRVEFLNRFDKVIMFRPLTPIEVEQITELMLKAEAKKLEEKGINLTYTKEIIAELARLGYDKVYGARELRRVIQERIEDPVARLIVEGKLKSGGELELKNLNSFVINN